MPRKAKKEQPLPLEPTSHSLANSLMFDYANATYNEFCDFLEDTMKHLIAQATNGIVAKTLIVTSMGISPFTRWRVLLTKESVIDGHKKLWAMDIIFNLQEQHILNVIQDTTLMQGIRNGVSTILPMYYGRQFVDELTAEGGKQLEAFKEKFTIELKGSGKLND